MTVGPRLEVSNGIGCEINAKMKCEDVQKYSRIEMPNKSWRIIARILRCHASIEEKLEMLTHLSRGYKRLELVRPVPEVTRKLRGVVLDLDSAWIPLVEESRSKLQIATMAILKAPLSLLSLLSLSLSPSFQKIFFSNRKAFTPIYTPFLQKIWCVWVVNFGRPELTCRTTKPRAIWHVIAEPIPIKSSELWRVYCYLRMDLKSLSPLCARETEKPELALVSRVNMWIGSDQSDPIDPTRLKKSKLTLNFSQVLQIDARIKLRIKISIETMIFLPRFLENLHKTSIFNLNLRVHFAK